MCITIEFQIERGRGRGKGRTNVEAGKFWYKIINREGAINEEVGKNFQS